MFFHPGPCYRAAGAIMLSVVNFNWFKERGLCFLKKFGSLLGRWVFDAHFLSRNKIFLTLNGGLQGGD